jgi:hypothetical protein
VPDELVQAATYRLPADRVFRAKVPDAMQPPVSSPPADSGADSADDGTSRLAVPKPRQA